MMMINLRALHCLLIVLPFLCVTSCVAESASSQPPPPFNINVGSSISAPPNKTNYWLSPSGTFAFGFHPSDINKVGIWIHKSSNKTLIWTAKLDNVYPIDNASSVLFDDDGAIVLKWPGVLPQPIFDSVWQPTSYAAMHDNGNFILYSSDSQIIWQSFDHPTDTIVSGQTLKSDNVLVSVNSRYQLEFSEMHMWLIDNEPNFYIIDG